MLLKKIYNLFFFTLITLFILCLYYPMKCADYCHCPEGFKVKESQFCPTIMSCPEPLIRISLYDCAIDSSLITFSNCKSGFQCWDGECVDSIDEIVTSCPTHISCPSTKNTVKCPDNTCVNKVEDCPNYVECPSSNPIRCGNGDCRKSSSDCPSLVHCPDNYPILCNDGSCRSFKKQCVLPTNETTCNNKTMTRCSDGTCTNSKLLCPTLVTCPVGYEKCYDGNCRLKGSCFKSKDGKNITIGPVCPNFNEQVLCQFDFSCASDINSCPTGIICPIDKPVKCWDNSCSNSVESCPAFQNCPSGLTDCPDGSCGLNGDCGKHITCSVEAPYRCFDNTCRRNPEDCPPQPSCPCDTPILCWDGRCLTERGECLSPSGCDNKSYIKCPNGICANSSTNCKEEFDCPSEFIKCKDGTCRKKLTYCPSESNSVNLPYKCENGLCVSDEKYCDKDKYAYINNNKERYCIDKYDTEKFIYLEDDKVKYFYDSCKKNQFIIENENGKYCIDDCGENKNERNCINYNCFLLTKINRKL